MDTNSSAAKAQGFILNLSFFYNQNPAEAQENCFNPGLSAEAYSNRLNPSKKKKQKHNKGYKQPSFRDK